MIKGLIAIVVCLITPVLLVATEFSTKKEYEEFRLMLTSEANKGSGQKAYALAQLYLQSIVINNKEQQPNYIEGQKWLEKADALGEKMATWELGTQALQAGDQKSGISHYIKVLKNDDGTDYPAYLLTAVSYGAWILDNVKDGNRSEFLKAANFIQPYSIRFNSPNLQFILAHLFYYGGKEDEGNIYLNLACNNLNANKKIKEICNNSQNIEVFNDDGQNLGSCPLR